MNNYELSPYEIHNLLVQKGVEYLYHANTVGTSLTFIEQNGLLSRKYVEENGLFQNPQKSDLKDKLYDVWDNVFLDGLDLHKKYSKPNNYGPVLFRLKMDLLTSGDITSVIVTKTNPMYWGTSTKIEDKYFTSIEELNAEYLTGKRIDARIMFTIRSPEKSISLKKYLHSIGLDEPNILINLTGGEKSIGLYAREALQKALNSHGLDSIKLIKREHVGMFYCTCGFEYNLLLNFNRKEFVRRYSAVRS